MVLKSIGGQKDGKRIFVSLFTITRKFNLFDGKIISIMVYYNISYNILLLHLTSGSSTNPGNEGCWKTVYF